MRECDEAALEQPASMATLGLQSRSTKAHWRRARYWGLLTTACCLRDGELDIDWAYLEESRELVARQEASMRELAELYGGSYAALDTWNLFKKITTVHNLGGCHVAESPDRGVVSTDGEVFGHPALYVADGSVIPTAIGSQPVMTISARPSASPRRSWPPTVDAGAPTGNDRRTFRVTRRGLRPTFRRSRRARERVQDSQRSNKKEEP